MLKTLAISFVLIIFSVFTGSSQTITSVSCATSLCAGKEVSVTYNTNGVLFGVTNIFTAQLSNSSGAFTTPVNIGTLEEDGPGIINAVIPLGTPAGTGYRIRVISSSPATTPTINNGSNITINAPSYPGISITATGAIENICASSSVSFSSTLTNAGTTPSFQWFVNNTAAGTNAPSFNFSGWTGTSQVFCVMTSNATCALPSSVASNVITVNPENNVSNSWLEKTSIRATLTRTPSKRNGAFTFSIGNKGYVGGGADELNSFSDFWEYDTVSGAWTQRASFAGGPRAYAVGFAISEKGYAGTGENQSGIPQSDFYRYDPATNSWSAVASYLGGAVTMAAGFSIGTKGYLGTGLNSANTPVADFYEFNPSLNIWSARAPYSGGVVSQASGFSIGSKGYFGLGADANGNPTPDKKIRAFDPSQNTWTDVSDYPGNARLGVSTATVGSKVYFLGGATKSGSTTVSTIEFFEFNPSGPSWRSTSGGSRLTAFTGTERAYSSAFGIGTRAYFGHGYYFLNNEEKNNQDFWIYNTLANSWTNLVSAVSDTNGRRGAVGFSIGNKGYICGGKSGSPGTYRRDLWEYNPATNAWTQKQDFPGTPRELAVAFNIGTKGYLGTGGYADLNSVLNDFWEYDQATNTWTAKTPFPGQPRYGAAGFSIGSKGYIGTGRNTTTRFKDFWEYNPSTNSWLQRADYGGLEVSSATGFSIENKGYIGTGSNTSNVRVKSFYEYNPTTNIWTQKSDFAGAGRVSAVGFGINGKGYLGSGENATSNALNDFWEYDTASNTWNAKTDIGGGGRFMGGAFTIGYKGYVSTGFAAGGTVQANDLWEYSPVNTRLYADSVSSSTPCAGSTITLHFSIGCYAFQSGNIFTAQLSAADGSFINPVNIGTLTSTTGGSMSVTIPAGTASGSNYRIRVIGSNPATIGIIMPGTISVAPPITVTTQPSSLVQVTCLGSTLPQLSVAGSGSNLSYQWYSNTVNNNTTGSIISGATLASFTPPTADTGLRYYYCKITSACGSVTTSNTSGSHTVRQNGSWLGGISTDWHNAGNWCGGVPQDSSNIILLSGEARYPVISSAPARCRNISLSSSTNITVNNQLLTINGIITQSSTTTSFINALNGDIELTHSSSPSNTNLNIQGTFFNQKTIRNLKLSKGGTITLGISRPSDTVKISRSISFGKSNTSFFIQAGSLLVIQSNATGTASISDMTSDGTNTGVYSNNRITGNVMIERYLANINRAWQFLAVPATGQSIKNSWQEGNAAMGNSRPGYGTLISSPLANPTTLGFDMTSFAPSMKTFNETTQNYDPVTNTSNLIDNPKGYMLFVRGDRSVTSSSLPPTPTTLRITGTIYQPTAAPPALTVPRGKFMSVGNPYASALNMSNFTLTGGVRDAYTIWDPRLTNSANSTYGLGGFRTLIKIGSGYQAVPAENTSGVSYYEVGNTNVLIQSGQAFFVQSDSTIGSGTITFTEKCKVGGSANVLRPSSLPEILRINLNTSMNDESILLDGAIGLFDASYNNRLDIHDIPKMMLGGGENISIRSGGRLLVAEQRKIPNPSDTIHLEVKSLRNRSYSLEFSGEMFSPYDIAPILADRYLGTFVDIEKTGISKYDFEVTANPASSASNRFYIIFRPDRRPLDISFR